MAETGHARRADLPRPRHPLLRRRSQPDRALPLRRLGSTAEILRLQRLVGNRAVAADIHARTPVVQRFEGREHRELGDAGSGSATVDLDIGDPANPLTNGDLVALSADYFSSPAEIMALAQTDGGKAEIRWARFESMGRGSPAGIGPDVKQRVRDRYYKLAAVNVSHFSAGGTARSEYARLHREALQIAFMASATGDRQLGVRADLWEAFSQHHLTDMFSAGHVRTPRADIRAWYATNMGESVARFVSYTAGWITARLDAYGDIPFWAPNSQVAGDIRMKVRELGGSAVDSFSLGDIVSLALHDYDNRVGLWVVSDLDPAGAPVPGGYVWPERAKGDKHLAESPLTRRMAEAAVRASLAEVQLARAGGARATAARCLPQEQLELELNRFMAAAGPPSALGYVPRAAQDVNQPFISDPQGPRLPGELDFRWGQLDPLTFGEVDRSVRQTIAEKLAEMTRSVAPPDGIVTAVNIAEWLPGLGPEMVGHNFPLIILHVRKAFEEYVHHLRTSGVHAIEAAMGGLPAAGAGP